MQYDLGYSTKHIVDLKRSKWDKDRAIPEKNQYFFAPEGKVYIKDSDYLDSASRPAHVCKFVGIGESEADYSARFGASRVCVKDHDYWPEPIYPNSEGHYVILDAVLVKIPDIEGYVDHRQAERTKGNSGYKSAADSFNADMRAQGASLKDEDITEHENSRERNKH